MAMARQEDNTVMLSRSEASRSPTRQALRFAQGDNRGKRQAGEYCHAEPQRSIS